MFWKKWDTFLVPTRNGLRYTECNGRLCYSKRIRRSIFGILEIDHRPYSESQEFQLVQILPQRDAVFFDYLREDCAYLAFRHRDHRILSDYKTARAWLAHMHHYPEEFLYLYPHELV